MFCHRGCNCTRFCRLRDVLGRVVLSQNLSAEDFQEVEISVTESNVLDQEVANLMLRKPGIFFAAMLPSLASQQQAGAVMAAETQQASAALLAAARARFDLFKLEYDKASMLCSDSPLAC